MLPETSTAGTFEDTARQTRRAKIRINPTAANGGADPESRDQSRTNAPNTVRTFGRIVSLQDFADQARQFAGWLKPPPFPPGAAKIKSFISRWPVSEERRSSTPPLATSWPTSIAAEIPIAACGSVASRNEYPSCGANRRGAHPRPRRCAGLRPGSAHWLSSLSITCNLASRSISAPFMRRCSRWKELWPPMSFASRIQVRR